MDFMKFYQTGVEIFDVWFELWVLVSFKELVNLMVKSRCNLFDSLESEV